MDSLGYITHQQIKKYNQFYINFPRKFKRKEHFLVNIKKKKNWQPETLHLGQRKNNIFHEYKLKKVLKIAQFTFFSKDNTY